MQFFRSFSEKMRDSSFSWKPRSLDESESDLEEELFAQRRGDAKRNNKMQKEKVRRRKESDFRNFLGYESTAQSAD